MDLRSILGWLVLDPVIVCCWPYDYHDLVVDCIFILLDFRLHVSFVISVIASVIALVIRSFLFSFVGSCRVPCTLTYTCFLWCTSDLEDGQV